MPYVIAAKGYINKHGNLTTRLEEALMHEDKDFAETHANMVDGHVVEIKRVIRQKEKLKKRPARPKKEKSNQSWMKGLSSCKKR